MVGTIGVWPRLAVGRPTRKERQDMKRFHTALQLSSFLAIAGAALMAPTSAQTVTSTYVACNADHACWRVHRVYAYGETMPITYYNSDWYAAHQHDEHIRWL